MTSLLRTELTIINLENKRYCLLNALRGLTDKRQKIKTLNKIENLTYKIMSLQQ